MSLCAIHPREHRSAIDNEYTRQTRAPHSPTCVSCRAHATSCPVCTLAEVEKAANVETWARLNAEDIRKFLAAISRPPSSEFTPPGIRDRAAEILSKLTPEGD